APPLEAAAAETSGASAGATSADRPRLFLVWQRPDESDSPATIEIDLIWFARDYQRQLIGYLKEGRYWFELAEPGSPPRQLGDSFYVRNGLVIDDPAGDGDASEVPVESPGDAVAPPDVPILQESNAGRDAQESTSIPASVAQHSAVAAGVVGLLGQRRRRRLIAAHADDRRTAPLSRLARLSRRVRQAALAGAEDAACR
ncbi:MAG: hypothetical protein WBC44_03420, partial [Planctomycetaceae bacterium]